MILRIITILQSLSQKIIPITNRSSVLESKIVVRDPIVPMCFHSLYLLPSVVEEVEVGLRDHAGGVGTLDDIKEEVT